MKRDLRREAMARTSAGSSGLLALLGGAAIGAAAMYLTDPDRGKRRRAIARDKMQSLVSQTGGAFDVASRDLGNRMQGLKAQARRMLNKKSESADDDVLIARVRSRLGRAVSHPHAIKVHAEQGRVHLSGALISESEKKALLSAVRSVHGVTSVEDHTEIHEQGDLPGLESGGQNRTSRTWIMRDTWPPGWRAVAAVTGATLGVSGVLRRTPGALLLGALGIGLVARSVKNTPLMRSSGRRAAQDIDLQQSIHIAAAPETVFDIWANYENFPRFMSNVKEVQDLGESRSHWVVNGPGGMQLEWDARLTAAERGHSLAWETEPESTIDHAGEVRFEPAEEGTLVTVRISYLPHMPIAKQAASAVTTLFNGDPTRQLEEDLRNMKEFIESGLPASGEPGAGTQAGQQTLH